MTAAQLRDFDKQILDLIGTNATAERVQKLVDKIYEMGYADGADNTYADIYYDHEELE